MRVKTICISERDLVFTIGGQLFNQAPDRNPRKAEIIMQKVKEAFRKDAHNSNEYYSLEIPKENVYKYIKDLLMAIPEFVELNLSQVEFENNVGVDDESRGKYAFSTRYDKYNAESWKTDFIDLDAFIGNVHCKLLTFMEADQDCFLCNQAQTDLCKTCSLNPDFKDHYEGSREPKGDHKFSCKFDCHDHYMICCEECKKKDTCANVCDGHSDTCGNKINERL